MTVCIHSLMSQKWVHRSKDLPREDLLAKVLCAKAGKARKSQHMSKCLLLALTRKIVTCTSSNENQSISMVLHLTKQTALIGLTDLPELVCRSL